MIAVARATLIEQVSAIVSRASPTHMLGKRSQKDADEGRPQQASISQTGSWDRSTKVAVT